MKHALSILMSALLGIHAVLGCCWHHAHAETPEIVAAEHHHDGHTPANHHHGTQDDSHCVFVRGEAQASSHLTSLGAAHLACTPAAATVRIAAFVDRASLSTVRLPTAQAQQLVAMLRC